MNRKEKILKNSMAGLLSQVTTILFTFLTRSIFIKTIGVELLGISSTFASVLGTLSLAELGFQSAITYSLYRPLHDQDEKLTNDIMNIFKVVYRCVGVFFVAASFVMLPFLKYILTDVEISSKIHIYFLLQAAASSCTYFFAYKRALLYADQKDYISKIVDLLINVASNILLCICLIWWKNFALYLLIKIMQAFISNLIVHVYCTKEYPYLHRSTLKKEKLREIMLNAKDVFAGRLASYIYTSTDNLVISVCVSTVKVGYLVNYTTITKSLKTLCNSMLSPIIPIIGNYLVDVEDGKQRQNTFELYAHIRFLVACFCVIPTMVLIDDFIVMWIGKEMLLPKMIMILLAIDFYIDIVHSVACDYIYGAGMFKEARNIEVVGAIANIVTSIFLVQFMGIDGVLLGTIVSQLMLWIGRSSAVFFKCLKQSKVEYCRYWWRNIINVAVFIMGYLMCNKLYENLLIDNIFIRFLLGGIICELILLIYVFLVFALFPEQKLIIRIISKIFQKRKVE